MYFVEICDDIEQEPIPIYLNYGPYNKTDTAEECRRLCQKVKDCEGWSWNPIEKGCWLKGEVLSNKVSFIFGIPQLN